MKVLLVDGFSEPNPIVDLADASLAKGGHTVTRLHLIDEGFARFMSPDERRAYHEVDNLVTPEQQRSAELVTSHDALVVCGPLVQGTIAPCIKSWFERVFIPEVAFTFNKAGRVTGALHNIRRVAMFADDPIGDPNAHRRNSSTRSTARGIRMSSAKTCRLTYAAVTPTDEPAAVVAKALRRW